MEVHREDNKIIVHASNFVLGYLLGFVATLITASDIEFTLSKEESPIQDGM